MSHFAAAAVDPAVDRQDPADRIEGQLALILAAIQELNRRVDGRVKSHYTVDEVAELTGRSAYTVRMWITSGRLAAIRVPGTGPKGRLLIPHDELRRLVTAGRAGKVPAALVDLPTSVGGRDEPQPGVDHPRTGRKSPQSGSSAAAHQMRMLRAKFRVVAGCLAGLATTEAISRVGLTIRL